MDSHKLPKINWKKRQAGFTRKVAVKEDRKIRARQDKSQSIWFGLGLLGLVGWSVVTPTLLAMALGIWIDQTFPSRFSWTLMLMVAGLLLGCLNAWNWVAREQASIERLNQPQSQPPAQEESSHE